MAWYDSFTDILIRDRRLEDLTTFRIGGPARYFFSPGDLEVLADLLAVLQTQGIPTWFLGRGSNLLGGSMRPERLDAPRASLCTSVSRPRRANPIAERQRFRHTTALANATLRNT